MGPVSRLKIAEEGWTPTFQVLLHTRIDYGEYHNGVLESVVYGDSTASCLSGIGKGQPHFLYNR
jgi:hypothetical protein